MLNYVAALCLVGDAIFSKLMCAVHIAALRVQSYGREQLGLL
jgi:hypothetical protein